MFMPSPMSMIILRRFDTTCSSVSAVRLTESRVPMTSELMSTFASVISSPVSGGKRISASCGYCEIHESSAPRSTKPICISMIVPAGPVP